MPFKGFAKRPLSIVILSLIYFLNPIGNIVSQVLIQYFTRRTDFIQFWQLLFRQVFVSGNAIAIVNVLLWIMGIVVGYGIYRVRIWAFVLFLVQSLSMVGLSVYSIAGKSALFAADLLILAFNMLFFLTGGFFIFLESVRVSFFYPKARLWEWWNYKRYRLSLEVEAGGAKFKTFDVSKVGMFIVRDDIDSFNVNDELDVAVKIGDNDAIMAKASVAWKNAVPGKYPRGIGVKFSNLDRPHQKVWDHYMRKLVKSGLEMVRK